MFISHKLLKQYQPNFLEICPSSISAYTVKMGQIGNECLPHTYVGNVENYWKCVDSLKKHFRSIKIYGVKIVGQTCIWIDLINEQ